MKNILSLNWQSLPVELSLKVALFSVCVLIVVIKFIDRYLKNNRIKHFLYNNGYVAENHKTKKLIYPYVKFEKKFIKIKNCIKKSGQQIFDEKDLWEQTFSKELKNRKIVDFKIVNTEIRLSLI